jgi:cytochrome bd-type quinol oxidase subunit 2
VHRRKRKVQSSYLEGALVAALFAAVTCGTATELLYSHLEPALTTRPTARAHDLALLMAAVAFVAAFFALQALAHESRKIAARYARAWLPLVLVASVAVCLRVKPAITSVCLLAWIAWAYPKTTVIDRTVLGSGAKLRDPGERKGMAARRKISS